MTSQQVAVVGGSVAGLSAALFLAERGHRVVVLERDADATPSAEQVGGWRRRGTPQAAHSHAFLARARTILATEAPDVLADLQAHGVREAVLPAEQPASLEGYAPAEGDDELVVLNARRSTFEWGLRRAVDRHPAIDLRTGTAVVGLDVHSNGLRRVRGVVTDRSTVAADVVVDAAGKRSPLASWLGSDTASEREVACGISYLTRFYQLHGSEPMALNRGFTHGASFDRYSCLVFPADDGAFSITFGVLPEDRNMRVLLDPAAFDAAARSIPSIAPWVDPDVARPTSDVALMASLRNVLRPPTPADVVGLHVIGDARCVTNPAHTRGTTLAMATAQHLADVVTAHAGDGHAQAETMAAFGVEELAEWVEDSVAQDAARLARWRPDEAPEQPRRSRLVTNGEAYLAAQRDPSAWRAFTRLQNAIDLPAAVLDDPGLTDAVASVVASGWRPAPQEAPSHDELVELAGAAAAVR